MAYFEELSSWSFAKKLTIQVYELMQNNHDYGFREQIQRAAVSIMNNIAEGSESGSDAKFINFLYIAKGSCGEVKSMLYLCEDFGHCTEEIRISLQNRIKKISGGIVKMIETLKNDTK